ncbi:MAG: energy-coupling factor transporter ATPase [Mogibacterium diversum]|jgi:cobalt import ATP-binding protein cbiO 2|uniref:ABC transporter ATP-binding protein n=1 Tax=Mogibacterium diversum TaxID=114527 RepID=A0A2S0L2D2_9FIRM|nr:energy-coupling factor transporter ATPase [Mogibacterium diversum]MDU5603310.1 energy-coupling factor transporter ATPase [Mogibacterium sp.]AVM47405.1 energy-coupling factor transporter ATPase [Mogibacterium diversum]MBF1320409.1 energy-coupling factor transporter ATPase [Mogibacterium diversum]MBF1323108.1 energy-coupling factor transporter ATPase [Mogibacterium diversum]MBF1341273.1 energy-coupling factor transporter ATPase [Mogibacterium diversum]
MANFIEVKDLVYRYSKEQGDDNLCPAIDHVSIEIKRGEYISIAGSNGSGKSTLARCLNGLLLPTEGEILVDGMDTNDDDLIWDIRKKIGMVFQNPDNQIVSSMVEDEVAFGPENIGIENPELRKRVDNALKSVGMYEYRNREAHKLSGGQKQRIAIAGAVAMRPDCIVFDEPTAMLDPKGRSQVMKVIRELNDQGITIILITHFMEEVAEADRVLVMKSGKLLADSVPEDVFADTNLIESAGLEIPAAVLLRNELIENGISLSHEVINKDDLVDALCR